MEFTILENIIIGVCAVGISFALTFILMFIGGFENKA